MDQERQIRFFIPPFFLAVSLLWGAYLSPNTYLSQIISPLAVKDIIVLLGIGTVAAIPTGYLIGTISHSVMRVLFHIFKQPSFEASLPPDTLERIWRQIGIQIPVDRSLTLYAGVTLDFEFVPKGVHDWITRRWHSFNIAINSAYAVELSHLVGYALRIPQSSTWTWTSVFLIAILTYAGCVAWRESLIMFNFQSHRILNEQDPGNGAQEESE